MGSKETQTLILDVAIDMFNQFGVGAVSANSIAKRCKISTGNLHYHFKTKSDIIQAIFERYTDERWDVWSADTSCQDINGLIGIFERYLALAKRFRFLSREYETILQQDERLKKRSQEIEQRRFAAVFDIFVRLVEAGELEVSVMNELDRLLRVSWLVSEGWIPFLEQSGRSVDPDSVLEGFRLAMQPFAPYMTEQGKLSVFGAP